MSKKRLGELLKDNGYINDNHIKFALKEQKATGELLGEVLVRLGIVTDREIALSLSDQFNMPFIDIKKIKPDISAMKLINLNFCRQQKVFAFEKKDNTLSVVIANPDDERLYDLVSRMTNLKPKFYISGQSDIQEAIETNYYLLEHPIEQDIERIINTVYANPNMDINMEDFTRSIFILAINMRSSDIHITPTDKSLHVHFRIDGVLQLVYSMPSSITNRFISNIKVRAGMDISEQRKPQDGRISFEFLGKIYDMRVSTVRTIYGENVAIRILGASSSLYSMPNLGFDGKDLAKLEVSFSKPYGIILISGPTGSGKTTTLYAALRRINALEKNIMTVEDPIEYKYPMARQTQVNELAGYDFSNAIVSFMRQDPDVMLIGEIRDSKTAQMAIRASMTGHLVLSTIHANDCIGIIPRLKDLGADSFLIASSLVALVAQRLVRKLCPFCKEEVETSREDMEFLSIDKPVKIYKKHGCPKCNFTGYTDRTVVSQILTINDTIRNLIAQDEPLYKIEKEAYETGMRTLLDDAKKKIIDGITDIEEVIRVFGK
jgi:type II secretory ATPase GspE/PulE/Tfp pilus assembly ATPase PilB-like protein